MGLGSKSQAMQNVLAEQNKRTVESEFTSVCLAWLPLKDTNGDLVNGGVERMTKDAIL